MITAAILVYLLISLPFVIDNMRDTRNLIGEKVPALPFKQSLIYGLATPLLIILIPVVICGLFVAAIGAFLGMLYGIYWIAINLP